MTLCVALAPVQECTDPFRVGAELDVKLWLSAIHVYDPRNRIFDSRAYAELGLPPLLHQPPDLADRPNLTFLRSKVSAVELDGRPTEEQMYGPSRTRIRIDDPLSLDVGFRRLQQGHESIPIDLEQPIATLGFLSASAHAKVKPVRVRVEAVLALDLEPLSPTLGSWRSDEIWIEGEIDVSNLDETTVIARLAVL